MKTIEIIFDETCPACGRPYSNFQRASHKEKPGCWMETITYACGCIYKTEFEETGSERIEKNLVLERPCFYAQQVAIDLRKQGKELADA